MLKKNDVIRLEICDLTNLGFGVGRYDGQVVFVSDTVPGDVIDAKIIKVNKSYAVGRAENIAIRSLKRCDTRCPITACKSCAYKNINYADELELKRQTVAGAFMHEGLTDVTVTEVIPSPALTEYRNKAQYPISMDKSGEYRIGFYAPKSHRVTEARRCPLAPQIFGEIIDTLVGYFKKHSLSVYDEECGRGLLRHIYLRRGETSGEVLLTLVINGATLPDEPGLVALITKKHPEICGILINTNNKNTNIILGDVYRTLFGRDYIYDTLAGVRLKITAPSFYQVNRAAAEILYAKARLLAEPQKTDTLLDLFCGAGSIGLSMADSVGELIGIEIVESAVECAVENARANGISHAKFYTGDAADTEKLLLHAEEQLGKKIKPDIIILDPPRAGCDERLIDFAARLTPKKIVYISCNPTTLARDCKAFLQRGYAPGEVCAIDLFAGTGHVESVVCLTRTFDNELQPNGCVN